MFEQVKHLMSINKSIMYLHRFLISVESQHTGQLVK